jgi:hypothetical protein
MAAPVRRFILIAERAGLAYSCKIIESCAANTWAASINFRSDACFGFVLLCLPIGNFWASSRGHYLYGR